MVGLRGEIARSYVREYVPSLEGPLQKAPGVMRDPTHRGPAPHPAIISIALRSPNPPHSYT
jgi:hypothetical protein